MDLLKNKRGYRIGMFCRIQSCSKDCVFATHEALDVAI
jgi:hypothetical protein